MVTKNQLLKIDLYYFKRINRLTINKDSLNVLIFIQITW